MPRPDTQSFTKLLISAGAILCIAAVVVPGLILRETDVLKLSRQELADATPAGREELERRQDTARKLGRWTPYMFVGMLGAGAILIGIGAPRLLRQEAAEEERGRAELAKVRSEIKPQTPEERQGKLQDDVAEGVAEELRAATAREGGGADHSLRESPFEAGAHQEPRMPLGFEVMQDRIARADEIAEQVLNRVVEIAPPDYEVARRVSVTGTGGMLFDGVLSSQIDQRPDVLVEVKVGFVSSEGLRRRVDEVTGKLLRYRRHVHPFATVWLIFVTDAVPPNVAKMATDVTASQEPVFVSVMAEHDIDDLQWPARLL